MLLTHDPAKWIVVGILACLHLTYRAWRQSETRFEWTNLLPGFATIFLTGCCCIIAPIFQGQAVWAPWIAIACGLILSGKQTSTNTRVGVTFLGMVAALGFLIATNMFTHMAGYMGSRPAWQVSHYQMREAGLPSLDRANKKRHFAAGYVDAGNFGGSNASDPGPFYLTLPRPLWHTFLTGVYAKTERPYRLWLPGGTAQQTLDGVLAIPNGTPPGKELEQGIPPAQYFNSDEDL